MSRRQALSGAYSRRLPWLALSERMLCPCPIFPSYLVVSPMDGKPAPKLNMSISAVMGNPRGSWTNA